MFIKKSILFPLSFMAMALSSLLYFSQVNPSHAQGFKVSCFAQFSEKTDRAHYRCDGQEVEVVSGTNLRTIPIVTSRLLNAGYKLKSCNMSDDGKEHFCYFTNED